MSVSKSEPILVVGAGAFGISTVYHLLEAGFTDITVVDKDEEVPSRFSAANDINKIVRAEYEDDFYTDLTIKAIEKWKTPLFAPHFHQTGFLHCVSGDAPKEALDTLNRFRASAERNPLMKDKVIDIKGKETIQSEAWQLQGPLPGWHGYLNRFDGYAHSGNAVKGLFDVVRKRGVKFILGKDGAVAEIVYETTAQGGKKSKGIKMATGRFIPAGLVIVAAGAAASRVVPEIGSQLVAKSWSVAHVLLTEDEVTALRHIPVTYARDLGFFFEPDPVTRLLKLCPMGGGYINTDPATGVSHAPGTVQESAFLPPHDEAQLRRLLAQTLPHLAERPLVKRSLCWFADTKESDFIIDYVPGTSSSVILLSGDSGHGFKMFPIVGEWVRDLLTAADGKQPVPRWRWKAPAQEKEGNWGASVSWRLGDSKEFVDIQPSRSKL